MAKHNISREWVICVIFCRKKFTFVWLKQQSKTILTSINVAYWVNGKTETYISQNRNLSHTFSGQRIDETFGLCSHNY